MNRPFVQPPREGKSRVESIRAVVEEHGDEHMVHPSWDLSEILWSGRTASARFTEGSLRE